MKRRTRSPAVVAKREEYPCAVWNTWWPLTENNKSVVDATLLAARINGIADKLTPEEAEKWYSEIFIVLVHAIYVESGTISETPYKFKKLNGGRGLRGNLKEIPYRVQLLIDLWLKDNNL